MTDKNGTGCPKADKLADVVNLADHKAAVEGRSATADSRNQCSEDREPTHVTDLDMARLHKKMLAESPLLRAAAQDPNFRMWPWVTIWPPDYLEQD